MYSLLDQIADAKSEFPMEVSSVVSMETMTSGVFVVLGQIALKLLDCDFPDESVRCFATSVLEDTPDERLEDILLQLTQVCATPTIPSHATPTIPSHATPTIPSYDCVLFLGPQV